MSAPVTVKEADEVYERHGKSLEKNHYGEYAAISLDGRVIVGKDDIEVVDQAIQKFGSGNFVVYRVGYRYVHKIRRQLQVTFDHGTQVMVET
jgi:hypothetical protein